MTIVYCKEWGVYFKKPHEIITEEEARIRYDNNEPYVAVLYINNAIKYVIEIDHVSETVRFYDDELNNYMIYGFIKKNSEKMFLNMVYHYKFENGIEKEDISFNFKENGEMYAEKNNLIDNFIETSEGIVDVSPNWEYIPDFGEYDSVIRSDR